MAEADRALPMNDDRLDGLRGAIALCRICRDTPTYGRLPHEPRPVVVMSTRARILIAGQAPGLRVHETGVPFNDASGDRLRQWLNVDRETFYDPDRFAIVPMGFCFPGYDDKGSDLPPRRECAPQWREKVLAAMPQVELVLAIGQYAQAFHLGERRRKTMTETVYDWRSYFHSNSGPAILPLPHPSWRNTGWLKKNPWFTEELLPVLREHVEMRL
ncbi:MULTISPECIES: uracil-DNA glycosylase family protein [Agrobacterium]|uniref:Uracil-DNA glycosylase family protein n=1 Tax=Agrobacterium tumefaciens TaxID=358 RepID=A0AAJ4T988_AGRTU|nr:MULTISPECIES: uracil-DNA glycosylase family protein [Agrobacterium]MEA1840363.1 uracil-DNA glycosylase family protein [Agrobacterium tumefaciens]NTA42389.1 uracil-DNA glycosylase family protein [Agrobacterium tumefaciens]NTA58835.1 uracil-DNA glycosylase family protein [Agrobacterium tumefaciens]QTG12675.1 uracil-DNA glycosylase family protein [Agrobacterium tumefaciens]UZX40590.1 uracil-DNA glycosylase family protein [Agrobacterium sp. 13-2099-1-2]